MFFKWLKKRAIKFSTKLYIKEVKAFGMAEANKKSTKRLALITEVFGKE